MSLNSQTQPITVQQLRAELLGKNLRPSNKVAAKNQVSVGHDAPFDAFHYASVLLMTLVVAVLFSFAAAAYVGFTGFTVEKATLAALFCMAISLIAAAIADWATPESKEVQRERIRRQKAALRSR